MNSINQYHCLNFGLEVLLSFLDTFCRKSVVSVYQFKFRYTFTIGLQFSADGPVDTQPKYENESQELMV